MSFSLRYIKSKPNQLYYIIKSFPQDDTNLPSTKKWNMFYLRRNPNVTLKIIFSTPHLQWDWNSISSNPNITVRTILKYPNLPWNWGMFSANPNLTIQIIRQFQHKKWSWENISRFMPLKKGDVENNRDLPWDWGWLSTNKTLTIDTVINFINKPWNWEWLSTNSNIKMSDVRKYPFLPWVWKFQLGGCIFENPNIDVEMLEQSIYRKTESYWRICLSRKRTPFPIDLVEYMVSRDPQIYSSLSDCVSIDYIRKNINKPWKWEYISRNRDLDINFILENKDKNWNSGYISENAGIKMIDINNNPDIKWHWGCTQSELCCSGQRPACLSENPNLTCEMLIDHPDKDWNFSNISQNLFLYDRVVFNREIQKDIKRRREKVKSLALYRDLHYITQNYIGYD